MSLIKSVILVSLLVVFLSGCVISDGEVVGDEPTVEVAPEGTERFHPDTVEEYGCPEESKTPTWIEIPGCK